MQQPLSGILNLNKPPGCTSHDVINRVRRILHQRRVGHAGTLDPMATGVLLVCVGEATRIVEYLTPGEKVYRAEGMLGVTTDTYDAEGSVTRTRPFAAVSAEQVQAALSTYVGQVQQIPPAYSAVKIDGVPAYRRSRRGEAVELAPRSVNIGRIDLIAWQPPRFTIEVTCGPGTYIRSLVHDLGEALGCGAHLAGLIRLRSGRYLLEDAITLAQLEQAAADNRHAELLLPTVSSLHDLTAVVVDGEAIRDLTHGRAIACLHAPSNRTGFATGRDGQLVAILEYDEPAALWQPRKVFATT